MNVVSRVRIQKRWECELALGCDHFLLCEPPSSSVLLLSENLSSHLTGNGLDEKCQQCDMAGMVLASEGVQLDGVRVHPRSELSRLLLRLYAHSYLHCTIPYQNHLREVFMFLFRDVDGIIDSWFGRCVCAPVGRIIGISDRRPRPPAHNDALETAFRKMRRIPEADEIQVQLHSRRSGTPAVWHLVEIYSGEAGGGCSRESYLFFQGIKSSYSLLSFAVPDIPFKSYFNKVHRPCSTFLHCFQVGFPPHQPAPQFNAFRYGFMAAVKSQRFADSGD